MADPAKNQTISLPPTADSANVTERILYTRSDGNSVSMIHQNDACIPYSNLDDSGKLQIISYKDDNENMVQKYYHEDGKEYKYTYDQGGLVKVETNECPPTIEPDGDYPHDPEALEKIENELEKKYPDESKTEPPTPEQKPPVQETEEEFPEKKPDEPEQPCPEPSWWEKAWDYAKGAIKGAAIAAAAAVFVGAIAAISGAAAPFILGGLAIAGGAMLLYEIYDLATNPNISPSEWRERVGGLIGGALVPVGRLAQLGQRLGNAIRGMISPPRLPIEPPVVGSVKPKPEEPPQIQEQNPQPKPEEPTISPPRNAPSVNESHIFHGEINTRGNPVGFHSRPGGVSPPNARVISITNGPDANGVYKATVEILNPATGQYLPKQSTFFPDNWPKPRVIDEISGAFQNQIPTPNRPVNYFEGISPSGVKIGGYLKPDGSINTAFPIM